TKAAMIQFSGAFEKRPNIDKAHHFVGEAVGNGAQIVCLQELFNTAYFCYTENPDYWDLAEPIPGPTIDEMSKLAAQHKIILVAPIYEKAMKGELYNTATVLGTDGEIIGKYRKTSIPLVKTPSLVGNEKYYFRPGNLGFPVWQTPFGVNIGIMICYDRHFPEHARLLALNGADLVFVPTATGGMSRYLWEIELQAHAIDNIYYVGGVNRVGADQGADTDQSYYGSSFFCDPKGVIVDQANDTDDAVVYAEIDTSLIGDLRNEWGFFRDRRPEVYAEIAS
ncbi:MAG: nitrilase-related carbon-nitrogen hydrolase, partial [Gaiellales bacterium]